MNDFICIKQISLLTCDDTGNQTNGNQTVPFTIKNASGVSESCAAYHCKTLEEFESLPEGTPCQLIDGKIVMTPSPVPYHQKISIHISMRLNAFVDEKEIGEIFTAPLDIEFSGQDILQPDIFFITTEHASVIGEKRIIGPPDLIVEILSESTAYLDLRYKKNLYEKSGVREYWIVDPLEKSVEVFILQDNAYRLDQRITGEGSVCSRLLEGFSIELNKIF